MPTIPFISSLFSSSAKMSDTTYPVQKTEGEWQAQLNPGEPPSPVP
jgi:peptide-methionine (R)-S-oxide reductase